MRRFFVSFLGLALAMGFVATTIQAKINPFLKGASTDVPPSAQPPEYVSLVDGGPLHIMSKITGVEFHVPGMISSDPGGLSPVPLPILREANGVKYWFISGELSAYATDELGQRLTIGPIDAQGTNHRDEEFCATCEGECIEPPAFDPALCCEPGKPPSHPRAGLPGAFFGLSIPVKGFNGGLVQIEAAGDGGTEWPAAPLLFNPVDPGTLLERGYAVFTYGQGGTVKQRVQEDGSAIVDTNPWSGSDIFWEDIYANGEFFAGLKANYRVALADRETGVESTLDNGYSILLGVAGEVFDVPFGCNAFFYGSLQKWNPEGMSDSVILAKNLVRHLLGKPVDWAVFVGWSGSGAPAIQIASSTRGGAFQAPVGTDPQAGGGNYNVWGKPRSGLRFDGFVSYAGVNDFQDWFDDFGLPAKVNADFPIAAPFVWFVPEYDSLLPQSAAYDHANRVWEALAAQGKGHKVNDYMRIYSLAKATHQGKDQLFAAFDSGSPKDAVWYEYKDILPNIGAFNESGRGLRVSDPYFQILRIYPPIGDWDYFYQGKARLPRDTPLYLQTFANLRANSKRGLPLPVSRVDPRIFSDVEAITTDLMLPGYATVDFFDGTPEEFLAFADELSHTIQEDTGIPPRPWARPPYSPSYNLTEDEVEEMKIFALSNQLKRSVGSLVMPDVAVPTGGPGFYDGDILIQRFLTKEEFESLYGSHLGYVAAFSKATLKLIGERLWEPEMGIAQIFEALRTKVPLASMSGDTPKLPSAPLRSMALTAEETSPGIPGDRDFSSCSNSWRCRQ